MMLMVICSNVFLSIMTTQAFRLLNKHGARFQFGRTLEIGCRNSLFTVKALLNTRWNHDLASYVGFVNFVKAYNTANHIHHLTSFGNMVLHPSSSLPSRPSTRATPAYLKSNMSPQKLPRVSESNKVITWHPSSSYF
jgi:hypothetical protein